MASVIEIPEKSAVLAQDFEMLINGELTRGESGETLASYDPATLEDLASFPNASPADVDAAVKAARVAQPAWRALDLADRQAVVLAVRDVIQQHQEDLALLDTLDTGSLLSGMQGDAAGAVWVLEHFTALSYELKGETTHRDHNLHYTRREPFGVVARLLPFNHPLSSLAAALATPLLTGNTVVLKPSPHTSLSGLALARLIKDVAPPGVINIITGDNERVSATLIGHPGVDRIAITASAQAGRRAMALAAENLKVMTLEGGGKNPLVVFPDIDLDFATEIAVNGMNFKHQSQSCASTSRILVHESIREEFTEMLVKKVQAVRVGLPTSPEADMGAISHKAQYEKTKKYIEQGKSDGARLLTGGVVPEDPALGQGLFLTPAVFDQVTPDMDLAQDEIFGPIISVMGWDDYDKMVEVANGTIYGLTAVILTNDINTALKTAEAMETGYVEINGSVSFAAGSPFGGVKQSGIGREGTVDDLLSYTQPKSVNINIH